MRQIFPIAALVAALSVGVSSGANNGNVSEPAFRDNFTSDQLGAKWATPKGEWTIENGALVGRELAADKHGAVLNLAIPNKDSHIHFRFQLDGARNFNLSLNHSKGHLFRVHFKPDGLTMAADKVKGDPASKVETIAHAATKFETGRWYEVDVEMQGAHVSVTTDNGVAVEGSHPLLDTRKPNYRFVMRDGDVRLDDVTVWMK